MFKSRKDLIEILETMELDMKPQHVQKLICNRKHAEFNPWIFQNLYFNLCS